MRIIRYALMAFLALWTMPAAAQQKHLAMRLVAETEAPRSGSTVTLAIAATPQPGWHGYWQNPGDAGFPARFAWTLPAGARAGEPRYPVPQRLVIAGLMNHVYERPYAMLVDIALPAGLAAGARVPIALALDYLVCTQTLCVPEHADLTTTLTIGGLTPGSVRPGPVEGRRARSSESDPSTGPGRTGQGKGVQDQDRAARFTRWRAALPSAAIPATFARADGEVRISALLPGVADIADAHFYPLATDAIAMAAPQRVVRDGDRVTVTVKAGSGTPATIDGVLSLGQRGIGLRATPGSVAASSGWAAGLALALLGAVLGGILLNVMPCVFPILSLKALHLARLSGSAGGSERTARAEALAYAAGVVTVCVALGGLLLALRAGGSAAGWAFQLQDPRVVGVLLLLVVAIALNLAGLFALPVPRFAGEAGGSLGAFATGALAAFVATPCTGPFMGAAMGAALVLPPAAALLVFAGLGLGIALPFLAIGFLPALRRRLPKPGAWMERVQRVLSVPMFATALALAWVLGRQAGVPGMTIGLGAALVLALGLWWSGQRQRAGRGLGWPALVASLAAIALVVTVRPAAAVAATTAGTEPFGEARLAALRAEGRPVFAYFTADWCLTCKVNEAAAIDTDATRAAFAHGKVAVLLGDWTDGDPRLGAFIQRHNRAGVPLYLWYAPGAREPEVLPQLLTPGMLANLAK